MTTGRAPAGATILDERAAAVSSPTATLVRRVALEGRNVVTIGRAGSDIDLDSPAGSRQHAVVERLAPAERHAVRDMRSRNGTFVDNKRVEHVELRRGAAIRVGPFRLVYDGASLTLYDERGALRIDARRLSQ